MAADDQPARFRRMAGGKRGPSREDRGEASRRADGVRRAEADLAEAARGCCAALLRRSVVPGNGPGHWLPAENSRVAREACARCPLSTARGTLRVASGRSLWL